VLSLLWLSLAFRMVRTVYRVLVMAPGVRTITRVPKLIGKGSHMAEPLIREARLSLGVIRLVATSEVAAGVVVEQYPREGRPVASGTPVDLTVASGELG
jgi:beta-lactam-binding protein with PASTA domain